MGRRERTGMLEEQETWQGWRESWTANAGQAGKNLIQDAQVPQSEKEREDEL